ncbi:MAG: ferric reductase-like transmembrane domain-containing protein [Cyclonatronaceae bacterium]
MKNKATFISSAALWSVLFIVLVAAPLFLASIGHEGEYRGFWIEFGVGLGFVGLAMMGLQFMLTARSGKIGAPFGIDELLQFHAQAGYIAYFFIIAHFTILLFANPAWLDWLNPADSFIRALALGTVIILLTALIVFTRWIDKLGIPYEWWRASHGLLAFLILFIGLVHTLQVAHYVTELWQQVVWTGMTTGSMAFLVHTRVWRPYQSSKRPYRVLSLKKEADETWSVELEADGHDGIPFTAGQFAWVTFGNNAWKIRQHPFTFSSSAAHPRVIRFTIKELGDFTSEIGNLKPGTKAFLEGPYGNFILDSSSSKHNFFIVGGIGITPVMSILETKKDLEDPRKSTLIYGTPDLDQTPFMDELRALAAHAEVDLAVIHVLEEPPEGWDGETGLITDKLLERYTPDAVDEYEYYVCGPPPMMDVAEKTLRGWGVPVYKIHSERFNIV